MKTWSKHWFGDVVVLKQNAWIEIGLCVFNKGLSYRISFLCWSLTIRFEELKLIEK